MSSEKRKISWMNMFIFFISFIAVFSLGALFGFRRLEWEFVFRLIFVFSIGILIGIIFASEEKTK